MKKIFTVILITVVSIPVIALATINKFGQGDNKDVISSYGDNVSQKGGNEKGSSNEKRSSSSSYTPEELFQFVLEETSKHYVEETDKQKLIEYALNGMLSSLDPHSGYLNEKEYQDMISQTTGEFGGLGIEITMENGIVKVVSPIDDTPAYRAGVKAGDYITHINGQAVMGMTLSEAVDKLRGPKNTDVKITIARVGASKPLELKLTRDIIVIQTIKSELYEDNIGYIRITSFTDKTFRDLKVALDNLQVKIGKDKKFGGIVLDLRNNPGGLLDQAICVSDAFISEGDLLITRGKTKESEVKFASEDCQIGDIVKDIPIVAVINGGSASASEIVAGALQDHNRAVVVGEKSFGKGSVQSVIKIDGGKAGAMKITTSRYYTPSGRSIQALGIDPDIIVKPAKVEINEDNKLDTKEANLKGHLENDNGGAVNGVDSKNLSDLDKLYESDYQLARAIDTVKAMGIVDKQNKDKNNK